MPVRIYEIAKKVGIPSKEVLAIAKELGITKAKVASSRLDKITAEYLEEKILKGVSEQDLEDAEGFRKTYDGIPPKGKKPPRPKLKPKGKNDEKPKVKTELESSPVPETRSIEYAHISKDIEKLKKKYPNLLLLNDYFKWPTTNVAQYSGGSLSQIQWPQFGVLSSIGYKVGNDGIGDQLRKDILTYAYFSDILPMVMNIKYMHEWGKNSSAKRLMKIANVIASVCRNMKKKKDDGSQAIRHWEKDLEWLRITFYVGKYDKKKKNKWPNSNW
jgi:hypothetical protein